MQSVDQSVEFLSELPQTLSLTGPVISGSLSVDFQRLPQLLEHLYLLRFGRVQFKAKGTETNGIEPAVNHFQCRHLF